MDKQEQITEFIVCTELPCGYPKVGQDCPYTDKKACPIYITAQLVAKKFQPIPSREQVEWLAKTLLNIINSLLEQFEDAHPAQLLLWSEITEEYQNILLEHASSILQHLSKQQNQEEQK